MVVLGGDGGKVFGNSRRQERNHLRNQKNDQSTYSSLRGRVEIEEMGEFNGTDYISSCKNLGFTCFPEEIHGNIISREVA